MARPFDSHQTRFERTFSAVFLAVVLFGAGIATDRLVIDGIPARSDEFALIRDDWDLLNFEYVRAADLDPSLLAHPAIGAMTYAVGDTDHTYFASADEVAAFNDDFFGPDAAEDAVDWVIVPGARAGAPADAGGPVDPRRRRVATLGRHAADERDRHSHVTILAR